MGPVDAILSVLGNGVSAIGSLFGISGSKARGVMMVILHPPLALASWLQSLFTREYDSWVQGNKDVKTGADGYADIASASSFAWDRLLNTILPNSLSWLDGHWVQRFDAWLVNIYEPFYRVQVWDDDQIFEWEKQTDDWRYKWVDPNITDWRNWHDWFDTWPHKMISWIYSWWNYPDEFANWAAPVLAWPLAIQYARTENRTLRDFLTETLVDSWPDVGPHVEQAVVAVLQTEGW